MTVLEGLRSRLGESAEVRVRPRTRPARAGVPLDVRHVRGATPRRTRKAFDDEAELQRAVEVARDSDVAVVVPRGVAADDRRGRIPVVAGTARPPARAASAIVETGTPVVLLVMNGRPLDLRWAAEHVPAILDVWYPGTQGGTAVANLLFGDVSPGGKLPFTWPRTVGQVPLAYAHTMSHEPENREGVGGGFLRVARWGGGAGRVVGRSRVALRGEAKRYWDEESTPLFPFGYGISYARFAYADLSPDRPSCPAGEKSHGLGHRDATPATGTGPRWSSCTCTSGTARPPGRSESSRASNGCTSRPGPSRR